MYTASGNRTCYLLFVKLFDSLCTAALDTNFGKRLDVVPVYSVATAVKYESWNRCFTGNKSCSLSKRAFLFRFLYFVTGEGEGRRQAMAPSPILPPFPPHKRD